MRAAPHPPAVPLVPMLLVAGCLTLDQLPEVPLTDAGPPCPDGGRRAPEACNGIDDDCDGLTDEDTAGDCVCRGGGEEVCNGWDDDCDGLVDEDFPQRCDACETPREEVCNGRDDDCDGLVDEDFSLVVGGADVPLGGRCLGLGACGPGWVTCSHTGEEACCDSAPGCKAESGPGKSSPEVCDSLDNDCDGLTDEGLGLEVPDGGLLPLGEPCEAPGECGTGEVVCAPDESGEVCCSSDPACGGQPAAAELCNGRDDDCDGLTDEDYTVIEGVEGAAAWRDGAGLAVRLLAACSGGPTCPDQAGVVACSASQLGACCTARNSTSERADRPMAECVPPGFAGPPEPVEALSLPRTWTPEVCDDLDNDCNGQVDNGVCIGDSR